MYSGQFSLFQMPHRNRPAFTRNMDALPASFIAPVSKGHSLGKAVTEMTIVLNSVANEDSWKQYRKNPKAVQNLRALGSNILEAAERNGYPSDKVITSAKGIVLGGLYKEFFNAMNNNDMKAMDRIARRIMRVGGTIKGLTTSMKNRAAQSGNVLSEEQKLKAEELLAQ